MASKDSARSAIGLVTNSMRGAYWGNLVAGATEILESTFATPICVSIPKDDEASLDTLKDCRSIVADEAFSGLVVAASSLGNARKLFEQARTQAAVSVGHWVDGVPSVWVQNGRGTRLMMQHLVEFCGFRRVAFIRGPEANPEAEARYRAYVDFLVERSIDPSEELIEVGTFDEDSGEIAALAIVEKNKWRPPDAIMAANDSMALGAIRALSHKGLSVPDDIAVVGFDDLEASRADAPLTTIRQPVREMGARAAELVLALLRGEKVASEHMFEPELVIRSSCGRGRRGRPMPVPTEPTQFAATLVPQSDVERQLETLRSALADPNQRASRELMSRIDRSARRETQRMLRMEEAMRTLRSRALEQVRDRIRKANHVSRWGGALPEWLPFLGLTGLVVLKLDAGAGPGGTRTLFDWREAGPAESTSGVIATALSMGGRGDLRLVRPLIVDGSLSGFVIASGDLYEEEPLASLCDLIAPVLRSPAAASAVPAALTSTPAPPNVVFATEANANTPAPPVAKAGPPLPPRPGASGTSSPSMKALNAAPPLQTPSSTAPAANTSSQRAPAPAGPGTSSPSIKVPGAVPAPPRPKS
jgi:DNA-binding LacI/PurR family transcriptional regulator